MEASIADFYQKKLAFLNKNFKEGSVIEEKFYGMFYGGQDNLDCVLESLNTACLTANLKSSCLSIPDFLMSTPDLH